MSIISDKKIFYINSRKRLNGTNSDFNYFIELPQGNEYDRVAVLQMVIPKSYYLVQEGQNTFILKETVDIVITVPPGNYTRKSFADVIQEVLNDYGNFTYTVGYDNAALEADTSKYYFYVTGNVGFQPSFVFTEYLYEQLGFNINSTNTFENDELISTNVIKLQSEDTLYLHSDICTNMRDNILQEVFTSTGEANFSNIHWQNNNLEAYSKNITMNTSNTYRFYLTNDDTQPIDLNGLNMQITLIVYKSNPVYKKVTGYILYKMSD